MRRNALPLRLRANDRAVGDPRSQASLGSERRRQRSTQPLAVGMASEGLPIAFLADAAAASNGATERRSGSRGVGRVEREKGEAFSNDGAVAAYALHIHARGGVDIDPIAIEAGELICSKCAVDLTADSPAIRPGSKFELMGVGQNARQLAPDRLFSILDGG